MIMKKGKEIDGITGRKAIPRAPETNSRLIAKCEERKKLIDQEKKTRASATGNRNRMAALVCAMIGQLVCSCNIMKRPGGYMRVVLLTMRIRFHQRIRRRLKRRQFLEYEEQITKELDESWRTRSFANAWRCARLLTRLGVGQKRGTSATPR